MNKLSKDAASKLAARWVGRKVTAACSGQLMTPDQARSLYGTAIAVDRVSGMIIVACDDRRTRRWPPSYLAKVLG